MKRLGRNKFLLNPVTDWYGVKKIVFIFVGLLFLILLTDKTFAQTKGLLDKHYNLAKKYYERGEVLQARKEFQEVLKLDPRHTWSKLYLRRIEEKMAEASPSTTREKADSVAWDAKKSASFIDSQIVKEHYHQAKKFLEQGDYHRAKEEFEKVLSLYPEHIYAQRYLREVKQRLSQQKEVVAIEKELKSRIKEEKKENPPTPTLDLAGKKEKIKLVELEKSKRRQLEREEKQLLTRLKEYKEVKYKREKGTLPANSGKGITEWQVREKKLEAEKACLLAELKEQKKAAERARLRQRNEEKIKREAEEKARREKELNAKRQNEDYRKIEASRKSEGEREEKLRQIAEENAKRQNEERNLRLEKEARKNEEGARKEIEARLKAEEEANRLVELEKSKRRQLEKEKEQLLARLKEYKESEEKEKARWQMARGDLEAKTAKLSVELKKYKAPERSKVELETTREDKAIRDLAQEELRLRQQIEEYEGLKRERQEGAKREVEDRLERERARRQQAETKLVSLQEKINAELSSQIAKYEYEEKLRLNQIEERLMKGKGAYNEKNLVSAKEEFEKVISLQPGHPEAVRYLALIGKVEEELHKSEQEKEEGLRKIAEEKVREERQGIKKETFKKNIDTFQLEAAEDLAEKERKQKEIEMEKDLEVRRKIQKAKEEELKKEAERQAISQAANILKKETGYQEEEEIIRLEGGKETSLLKKEEDKSKLKKIRQLYNEGKRCFREGRYEEAIAKFEEVIRLEGNPRILYTPYAKEYIEESEKKIKENQDKEKREIEEVKEKAEEQKDFAQHKIKEKKLEKLINQAKRLHREGLFEEAISKYEEALEKAPHNDRVSEYLSRARRRQILEEEKELSKEEEVSDKEMQVEAIRISLPPKPEEKKKKEEEKITPILEIPEIRKKLKIPVAADFRDVDLSYVLSYLSESTGVNIISSANVSAEKHKVTIQLKDMPLEYALKYILKTQGLTYRVEEEAVWVTTSSELEKEETETRVYFLKKGVGLFAEFEALGAGGAGLGGAGGISKTTTLKDILEKSVSWPKDSKIVLDERTGALVITNTPSNFKIIEEILYNLDVTPVQVLIEARFLEVVVNDIADLGIEWKLTSGYDLSKKSDAQDTKGPGVQLAKDSGVDFTAFSRASEGLNLSFQGVLSEAKFEAILHALEESKKTKTLSAPRITTLNNQEASIRVVDEWIYPTRYEFQVVQSDKNGDGDFNDAGETSYKNVPLDFVRRDVGILLRVTPSVGADRKTITLALIPEVSEAVKDYFEYTGEVKLPKFTSRNLSTSVIVDNNDTVVLGGLIKEARTKTRTKVPLLGDLPVLGLLFRKDSDDIERKNLLIFVTAKLLSPSGEEISP